MLSHSVHLKHFLAGDEARTRDRYAVLFERIDKSEKTLRIFEDMPPNRDRILGKVHELFRRYPKNSDRPPLFCVPVGVKGIFRTEGERIRAGSLLPPDLFEGAEARTVTALREAGAIILGITATTEFAFAEPGGTCNPRNTAHTPGGSSSGSAAGVAAGFFPLALGTQTIGSVIRPASYCGVTGFKPSHGLLPTDGLLYFSRSADHVGLFCATPGEIEDCLKGIVQSFKCCPPPKKIRLGVPLGPYLEQAGRRTIAGLHRVLERLAAQAELCLDIVDAPCLKNIAEINRIHRELIASEFAAEHRLWFERYRPLYRPRTAECIRMGQQYGQEAIRKGRESQIRLRRNLEECLSAGRLDAFVCPSAVGEADKTLDSTGDPVMNLPWTHAGLPAVSLPCGVGEGGLPLGMQLAGFFGADASLLALAKRLHEFL
ncbi:MAG: amidase [Desulfovibrio sp.]|jgi:Asp-tRNA(Asn)/Glu-tRNA(Gln) amidotransferase A subunit family amidase|nr:amidase [Desulfovibrio sp.]